MCTCFRNWQGTDCSERTCQFGLAHVDSPKGDLDMSNSLSDAATSVLSGSTVYPHGTTERFPAMKNAAGTAVAQTAHYYMECANKGLCNRKTGECECFPGYDGSACQRADCPNKCSGHGVCKTARQIAKDDYSNSYELWDKTATMGCVCDAGYHGPDCSLRSCKSGVDPLYPDDEITVRYAQWVFLFAGTAAGSALGGTYSVRFFDITGEDWETAPISGAAMQGSTTGCDAITDALEALPNDVIPADSITCTGDVSTATALKFTLWFKGNPGNLREPEVNVNLDGSVATLTNGANSVTVSVYNAGVTGESTDFVPTHCSGVTVQTTNGADMTLSTGTLRALKACLGDSDGDGSNNVDVSDWDYGFQATGAGATLPVWPHLVKLSPTTAVDADGSYMAVVVWDSATPAFVLSSGTSVATATDMNLFTTDSTLELLYVDDGATVATLDSSESAVGITTAAQYTDFLLTSVDTSCTTTASTLSACLEKGDQIVLVPSAASTSLTTTVLYEVERVLVTEDDGGVVQYKVVLDKTLPVSFASGYIYKLTTASETYEFVQECSGRGLCDESNGLCECFRGYTNDNCNTQASIAMGGLKSSSSATKAASTASRTASVAVGTLSY